MHAGITARFEGTPYTRHTAKLDLSRLDFPESHATKLTLLHGSFSQTKFSATRKPGFTAPLGSFPRVVEQHRSLTHVLIG
jgi:hypothetical protein